MELKRLFKYINYRLTAYTEHDLHSPFLYNFYMELIKNEFPFGDFEELQAVRQSLEKNTTAIHIVDLGAGSKKLQSDKRFVNQIAKHGIAQKKQAEFMYRLLNKFAPTTVVELGTSIGLTTLYLSKASPRSDIYSIEGCPDLVEFSQKLFIEHHARNIQNITGNFDTAFPHLLKSIDHLDLLYIDGNHAYEPTIRYFNMALEKKTADSIFVFDDIYWSAGMLKAWKEICAHPDVTLSLDLFYFGIVFFRSEQKNKEHFVLKF
ncbi:MAG: O-methyltransferase-like protein [Bacteroidetes bacterium]|jgi:predicted O-methyltransferase YrrM|nr:O-methyltransferase-like protein [Bacteroidota bacterium]MDF2451556.1 O-methyltransferase-like protein [Bacteroidota bacterium]